METVVNLSRLQFAVTAIYHFLFVPLTIGLAMLIAIMESVYVLSGKDIWLKITKFWAKLFAINFAMGIATGITMEFQFGTNWAYYAYYIGDIFGVPLAIEGMMAFFLESTFVGLMIFGWNKLSKLQHLTVTWLTAIGSNLSALWILIANAWMQRPVGAKFNPDTMRMELTSLSEIMLSDVAQEKFVHTISASYIVGAIFVVSISAFYLLSKFEIEFARKSIIVATSFGLLSSLSTALLGDQSGYTATMNQKSKIAAIEAMWETEEAPASFTIFGFPDKVAKKTHYAVKIPYLLGLVATRSLDKKVMGIKELVIEAEKKIKEGIDVYLALEKIKIKKQEYDIEDANNKNYEITANPKEKLTSDDKHLYEFVEKNFNKLGYALLLKRYRVDIENATEVEIKKAAENTIPNILPLFFCFRFMVLLGLYFIILFAACFYYFNIKNIDIVSKKARFLLKTMFYSLPLPWIACTLGWIVAEHGRQPWAIEGILPTFLGASSISAPNVLLSLISFIVFYTTLTIIDIYLMIKYIKVGPK